MFHQLIVKQFIDVILIFICAETTAQTFSILSEKDKVTIVYHQQSAKLDSILAYTLAKDIFAVTGYQPQVLNGLAQAKGNIIVLESAKKNILLEF